MNWLYGKSRNSYTSTFMLSVHENLCSGSILWFLHHEQYMQVRHSLLTEQVVPGLALAPQIPQLQIPLLQTDFTISLKYFKLFSLLAEQSMIHHRLRLSIHVPVQPMEVGKMSLNLQKEPCIVATGVRSWKCSCILQLCHSSPHSWSTFHRLEAAIRKKTHR